MEIGREIQRNMVVLGAGYGGLRTALRSEKLLGPLPDHRILLVDQNQHHQLITHLHEVVGGRTPAGEVALPLDRVLGARLIDFRQARVTGLDLEGRRVFTDRGGLPYEKLVIALGSETNFYGIPGMREHAFTLKSLGDACLLQGHIHEMLAWGAAQTDPQVRQEALTFVVGGGGFTGTELAAELAEYLPRLASRYGLAPREPKVVVLEAGQALLPGLDARLAARAARLLRRRGLDIAFGSPAQAAEARGVVLASGQRIASRTLIWTGGVRAPEMLGRWGLPTGVGGRVVVDAFLEVEGHPGVYVVGDSALVVDPVTQRPAAPSAQLAVAQGEAAAWNIFAGITGASPQPYQPHLAGEAISLGARDGVAWVGPLRLVRAPAQWLKAFIARRYLWETGGLELLRTSPAMGRRTLWRDFPQCLMEFRPTAIPPVVYAGR